MIELYGREERWIPLYERGTDIDGAIVTNTVEVRGNRIDPIERLIRNQALSDQFHEYMRHHLRFEVNEAKRPHPEEAVKKIFDHTVTLADGAANSIHHHFMDEADKIKNTINIQYDVRKGLSRVLVGLEQDKLSGTLSQFYARNPEALKEAVEKIQDNIESLRQVHGDLSGKAYGISMLTKITGGISNVTDGLELGKRFNAALESGDWNPVIGQVSKMVIATTAGIASASLVRSIGLIVAGASAAGAGAVVGSVVIGALISVGISFVAGEIDNYISKSEGSEFGNNISKISGVSDDLAVVGNVTFSSPLKISAKNEVSIIGNQHFKDIEVTSKNISVIGTISSDENIYINGNLEVKNGDDISDFFKEHIKMNNLNAVETIESQPEVMQSDADKTVGESGFRKAFSATEEEHRVEVARQINPTIELGGHNYESHDLIFETQKIELEKIFGISGVQDMSVGIEGRGGYKNISPVINLISEHQEMPLI